MKSPEQFNPEENAKEVIESLKDTEAGKYMEGEPMPSKEQLEEAKTSEEIREEFKDLVEDYSCGIDVEPKWCIFGSFSGGEGVLLWIKPTEDSKEIAEKIASLMSRMGGDVRAEMTEWNEELEGEPIYNTEDILGRLRDDRE